MTGRFNLSMRMASALVLAYGLSLWFEWWKPMWAAFSVILVSTPSLRASLAKAGERLGGTLLAMPVALALIAMFPQQRWAFLLAQGIWLAFCTYRMGSSDRAYFWFCAGFVSSIIAASGGPHAADAFSIAIMRTLETALGILCYTLFFAVLWPVADGSTAGQPAKPPQLPPVAQRMNAAAQVFIAYSIGFLLVVYVPDFPGDFGFLAMLAPFALLFSTSPLLSPSGVVLPVGASVLFAAPIYLFVMPLLSGFGQLAGVIFAVSFAICWFLHKPEQALGRTFALAFFAVVTGISNDQTYSFLGLANTVLMFALVLLVLYVSTSLRVFTPSESAVLAEELKGS